MLVSFYFYLLTLPFVKQSNKSSLAIICVQSASQITGRLQWPCRYKKIDCFVLDTEGKSLSDWSADGPLIWGIAGRDLGPISRFWGHLGLDLGAVFSHSYLRLYDP